MVSVAVVVGNPKPQSRTLAVARAVARQVCSYLAAEVVVELDLIEFAAQIFDWPNERLAALNAAVASSDVVVVASPTYKATYTGLLKAFFDRYPNNGLTGVTAVPVMTGASPWHAMSIDLGLRPLLVELGASVPTRGLFFLTPQIASLDEIVDTWASENLKPGGIFAALPPVSAS